MNSQTTNTTTSPANGASVASDLLALTDEQILEIAPEAQDVEVSSPPLEAAAEAPSSATDTAANNIETGPFAAPEEVRALAELYPGGLSQAKAAAERARALDEIDAAYFGTAAGTPEQVGASRAQLAQRMLHENPAAFREMVFAGLRVLEEAGGSPGVGQRTAQPSQQVASAASAVVAQHAAPESSNALGASPGNLPGHDAQTTAYAAFERNANAELERSVGSAIERTIAQALPNLGKGEGEASAGTRTSVPLRERLASSVRQDVEAALKGDRQLGEQIAQILAARRFDDTARAQVVRLIGERAQQLVPGAARRVINEWTGTTLAAHGAKSERSAAASGRREVAPASTPSQSRGNSTFRETSRSDRDTDTAASRRSVDYRKLSDQQILDL